MRIGIIGSGISGLSAAFFLGKLGHMVTLIEKHSRIGMGAYATGDETERIPDVVDVPSRLSNLNQWPNLLKLYGEAGIETVEVPADQTYSDANGVAYLQIDPQSLFNVSSLSSAARLPGLYSELRRLRKVAASDLKVGIAI